MTNWRWLMDDYHWLKKLTKSARATLSLSPFFARFESILQYQSAMARIVRSVAKKGAWIINNRIESDSIAWALFLICVSHLQSPALFSSVRPVSASVNWLVYVYRWWIYSSGKKEILYFECLCCIYMNKQLYIFPTGLICIVPWVL